MINSENMQIKQNVDVGGLLGFTLSGAMFVISALRTGDQFALAGSIIWILSCVGWIFALLRGVPSTPTSRSDEAAWVLEHGASMENQQSESFSPRHE